MRISTNLIYQQAVANMQRQQSALAQTQQQMSLGTRIVSPSDDPVAAARVLIVEQAKGTNEQYAVNRGNARSALSLEESVLANITTLIQDVHTSAVYAGNATLSNADRAMLATELSSRFQQLLGLANSTDGAGLYLFSGYQGTPQPFSGAPGSVAYNGDQGQRLVQVSATRQIPVSDSGDALFQRIPAGQGVYLPTAAAGNAGDGVLSAGRVTDATLLTGDVYTLTFRDDGAGGLEYEVLNRNTGAVTPPVAYTPGAPVAVDGLEFDVTGNPAADDAFTFPRGSVSLFETLGDLITALNTPASDAAGKTQLSRSLDRALAGLDTALDTVLSVRADVGARLQELDGLDDLGASTGLQHEKTLSDLRDLDYAAAISDFTRQQMLLEAAQASFTRIAGMSLFDYL